MTTNQNSTKGMNIALWISQVLLGAMFIMTGSMKLFQSVEELSKMLPWVNSVPLGLIKFIGVSELLGGLGLIIPSAFRFKPVLTIWAAIGISLIMVLASAFHISRGENSVIGMNFVLLAIAIFIVWGRTKKVPIYGR